MHVLIGTTNPSKAQRFADLLKDCEVEFVTLSDLKIEEEPEETGRTPEENAIIKAEFYGRFFDRVICNDSGLYFEELALSDERQPGLHVRTPLGGKRLNDEEMIDYYAKLAAALGGKVTAYYLDGIAVYNQGKISSFMDEKMAKETGSFYMVEKPSEKRQEGWPLDSLSKYKDNDNYFVDNGNESKENIIIGDYEKQIIEFLKVALA